ncbi:hypothetical protein ACRALDRAFT_1067728 [Sodiomyces alcalophilus JCM 7366]|uniref:uncharacterized protein n=1 Tax=Sodiomyces alcalophilus JCM 7366 TaxID=591952 RepID=UPI0039B4E0CC
MTANSRKRPAPGASPAIPMPVMQPRYSSPANAYPSPTHDLARWHDPTVAGAFVDGTTQAVHPYAMMPSQQPPPQQYAQPPASNGNTTLARRHINRALVPTAARPHFDEADPWSFSTDDPATLVQQTTSGNLSEQDSIEALEELAIKAKREAQSKRKQIPPFVQKLSSFLDEEKNIDLIRWSDKGDSFIVLDEDEFAKTLIPELFKHNNYASFVRQLNMYGFHKRVGLSDNSMRASERKNKSPSEYSNPYFRRGHPNLLWLINKPKSGSKSKSKAGQKPPENDPETDEEAGVEEVGQGFGGGQGGRALPSGNMPLDRKEMALVREELAKVREQQKMILNAITRMQRDNSTLYQQAVIFQEQHDRHQNSINAILNFLANVFRKTLEDQNSQNVNELLANIMPGNSGNSMPQGSVVDLGDFVSPQVSGASPGPKRTRGLLPPIPAHGMNVGGGSARASMASSSSSSKATPPPPPPPPYHGHGNPVSGTVTELFDHLDGTEAGSPAASDLLAQELKSNPRESMMKLIQDTNASRSGGGGGAGGAGGGMDLPEMVANAPTTMTNDQREQMLNNMIAQTQGPEPGTMPNPNDTAATTATGTPGGSFPNTPATTAPASTTAGHTPIPAHSPPPPPTAGGGSAPNPAPAPAGGNFSLSPAMNANPAPPSLNHINNTTSELDSLHRMTQDSNERLATIQNILSPLSPSGRIPGLDDMENAGGYFETHNLDLDQFLDTDAFDPSSNFSHMDFTNPAAAAANPAAGDFDFGILNEPAAAAADPVAGGPSVGDNPSPSGTEEIPRGDDFGAAGNLGSPSMKRRRVG